MDAVATLEAGLRCIGLPGIGGSACGLPSPDADRPVDVLDRYLSAVLEADVDAIADAFVDNRRYADTARLGERLELRGDVDTVAVDVLPFHDHVAEIDADPQHDGRLGRPRRRRARPLHRQGAVHGIDHAGELDDGAIADQLHDPAVVGSNGRVKDAFSVPLQGGERTRLVGRHQPRVADNVGCEDRRQFAIDAFSSYQSVRACGKWLVSLRSALFWKIHVLRPWRIGFISGQQSPVRNVGHSPSG